MKLLIEHNQEIAQLSPDPFPLLRAGSGDETRHSTDLFRGAWQRLRNALFEARGSQNRRTLYAELREMSEYYQLLQGPAKEICGEDICLDLQRVMIHTVNPTRSSLPTT